jgi:hypothetical protein
MEPETGGDGSVQQQRAWWGANASYGSEIELVGGLAAQVLEDLYGLVYGERPVGVRAWYDGTALLLVVRLAGPADADQAEIGTMLPSEGIPELVATAVRAQTGWDLSVGSWSVEADLGLVMFVFRVPDDPPERPRAADVGAPALATSAEVEARRSVRWQTSHLPAWRAWSPVPSGAVAPDGAAGADRRRLRIVED